MWYCRLYVVYDVKTPCNTDRWDIHESTGVVMVCVILNDRHAVDNSSVGVMSFPTTNMVRININVQRGVEH